MKKVFFCCCYVNNIRVSSRFSKTICRPSAEGFNRPVIINKITPWQEEVTAKTFCRVARTLFLNISCLSEGGKKIVWLFPSFRARFSYQPSALAGTFGLERVSTLFWLTADVWEEKKDVCWCDPKRWPSLKINVRNVNTFSHTTASPAREYSSVEIPAFWGKLKAESSLKQTNALVISRRFPFKSGSTLRHSNQPAFDFHFLRRRVSCRTTSIIIFEKNSQENRIRRHLALNGKSSQCACFHTNCDSDFRQQRRFHHLRSFHSQPSSYSFSLLDSGYYHPYTFESFPMGQGEADGALLRRRPGGSVQGSPCHQSLRETKKRSKGNDPCRVCSSCC